MILFGIVTILALVPTQGAIIRNFNATDEYLVAGANEIVDQVTPYLGELIKRLKLDPAAISDTGFIFSVKGIFNTYHGRVNINQARLYDLSTIQRDGDFTIYYKNKHLRFETNIGFNELTVYSRYELALGFLQLGGMVTAKAKNVKATAILDFYINDYNLTLQEFNLGHKIQFNVKLHGNPLLDWLATPITNFFLKTFSGDVINVVGNNVITIIKNYVNEIRDYFPRANDILPRQYVYNYSSKTIS